MAASVLLFDEKPTLMKLRSCILYLMCAGLLQGADDYVELCQQAAQLSAQSDFSGAIEKYKAALVLRPKAPDGLNNLAVMYYQVGQFAEAFKISSSLWPDHPELPSAALIAGMAAVQCSRPKEAIAPLTKLLAGNPTNRDGRLALASAYVSLKQLAHAVPLYEGLVQSKPDDQIAWYGLAICYENLAEDASRQLAKLPGGASYSKRLLGEYLQSVGDNRLAAEAFGEAATGGRDDPEAGHLYDRARMLAQNSREAFEKYVSLAPDSWQSSLFRGDVERQQGHLKEAIAHYEAAAKQQPRNPGPLLGLATSYWELGDFDKASQFLQRVLELNPHSPQAIFESANILVRQRRDEEAAPLLRRYLSMQPDALAAHADLGRAYFHLKQYGDAIEELSKATAIDTNGDIHYQLSVSLKNQGRVAEAESALAQSKTIRETELKRAQRLHAAP